MQNKLILEAIALQKPVQATYNKASVTLAPHILYTRHGELSVDPVTNARDGRSPREVKIGTFKVSGLRDLALVERRFDPQALFDPNDAKYDGVTLFAIEKAAA
ncbi:MAG: hypothetical protein JWN69_2079 [Alphaproteobacteria bacterium]|nr:hypothetical protein [Alphaproteobacteria bacterium]